MWIVPSERTGALGQLTQGFAGALSGDGAGGAGGAGGTERRPGSSPLRAEDLPPTVLPDPAIALAQARRDSDAATADAINAGTLSGTPADRRVEAGQRPYTGHQPPVEDEPVTTESTPTHPIVGRPPAAPRVEPQPPQPPAAPEPPARR
jgi:hypothetical protein